MHTHMVNKSSHNIARTILYFIYTYARTAKLSILNNTLKSGHYATEQREGVLNLKVQKFYATPRICNPISIKL